MMPTAPSGGGPAAGPSPFELVVLRDLGDNRSPDYPDIDFDASSLHPLLRKWRYIARQQKTLHAHAYQEFHRRNVLFMVSIILLSGVSGFGGILVGALQGQRCPDGFYYTVATGLLSVISASLGAVYNVLSLAKKEAEHEAYCTKFQELVQDINTEAAIHEINNTPVQQQTEFIRKMNLEFHSVREKAPSIPSDVERRVMKQHL